ncbi:hypothetical protein [Nonlabens sp.]|uniref:hypothetical protein n=1 Tax=Nonlabens sp. TaxID=1888209 RepID=UPI001BCD6806|nr:hypothetical protein [Nonlabens sp.]
MKTKICATCQKQDTLMYRVQIDANKQWVFCCKSCTEQYQSIADYKYGGTWKGNRH